MIYTKRKLYYIVVDIKLSVYTGINNSEKFELWVSVTLVRQLPGLPDLFRWPYVVFI